MLSTGTPLICERRALSRLLARVGVAVDSVVVRIFVGVEGYAQLGALVIVARGGVGREVADILPYEIAYVHGLSVCAAGAEFVSAAVCRPFGDGSVPVLHCFVRPCLLGPAAGRLLRWAITGFRSWRRFHSCFRSRSVTAFLCAPSPSAAAIVSITPPIRCNPAGEISWKVILRMKLSRFTPLHERAPTVRRQCVVRPRGIVARAFRRVISDENASCGGNPAGHLPRVVHRDDQVLGGVGVRKFDHLFGRVHYDDAAVVQCAGCYRLTGQFGELPFDLPDDPFGQCTRRSDQHRL